jgi:hypothetical protein
LKIQTQNQATKLDWSTSQAPLLYTHTHTHTQTPIRTRFYSIFIEADVTKAIIGIEENWADVWRDWAVFDLDAISAKLYGAYL